jgi:hypothetical protein
MKLPYGQSNFKNIAQEFYYVDRTMYIERLEAQNNRFLFYLRPRKFGKSLFVSMLEHYYGQQHQADFEQNFGRFYIGRQPTPLANQYLVLKFDFSGIKTDDRKALEQQFANKVRLGILAFMSAYRAYFTAADRQAIQAQPSGNEAIGLLFELVREKVPSGKLYILIDEYDHFANELVAFYLDDFKAIVSRNGFMRKFFELIKVETASGLVERLFATGVSPVTLDSLTSGFNIAEKLSEDLELHDMMGFTEQETMDMLSFAKVAEADMPRIIRDLRDWYDGYCFNPDAPHRLYNPEMVIYFANHYWKYKTYPEELLDENIASDYHKLQRMLQVGGPEMGFATMEEVLSKGWARAALTKQFTFERPWTPDDQVSLLYYLGMLTVKERALGGGWAFQVPNLAIHQLYYKFFFDKLRERAELQDSIFVDTREAVIRMSVDNELGPLLAIIEQVLARLSNRDMRGGFNEGHLKAVVASLLVPSRVYLVRSEPEAERQYVDLLCIALPEVRVNWNFAFEIKYLKKEDAAQLPAKAEKAKTQLEGYLQTEDLQRVDRLAAYAIVFVGAEAKSVVRVR